MSKKYTGIYIGINRIAIAQISYSFKKISLDKIIESDIVSPDESDANIPIESSVSRFEEEDKNSDYATVLKKLLEENNFYTENIILVLPSRYTMVRYFTIPNLSKREIASAIKFEAKKYIPFNLDEVETDYYVNRSSGLNKKVGILFTAVKKELLEEKLSILRKCGVKPKNIRISSLSLLNTVYRQQKGDNIDKNRSYGIIDVNEQVATITIFKEGMPYLIRDFSLSGSELKSPTISEEDYENFLHELHLSMEYYYGQPNTTNIDKLFLFDDGTLRDKISNLNSEFNIPIVQPDISNIARKFSISNVSFQGMLTVATVVDECLKSKINISISPEGAKGKVPKGKFDFKKVSIIPRIILLEVVGLLIAGLIIYIVMDRTMLVPMQKEIDKVIKQRAVVLDDSSVNLSKNALNKILVEAVEKEKLLSYILYDRVYLTDKLSRLVADLPKQIWFNVLEYRSNFGGIDKEELIFYMQGSVFVESGGDAMSIITEFIRNLKNDPIFMEGFSDIELVSVTKGAIREFPISNFQITCR